MLRNCVTLGETPGPRWGNAWLSVRFSDAGVTEDLFSLSSVIEVKYASRGPPYIAGSELFSRVSWCESQLLIGSSRSVSIRGVPECLGRFDVRYTFNPLTSLECAACVTRSSRLDLAGRLAVKHRESVNHCPNILPILLANLVFLG